MTTDEHSSPRAGWVDVLDVGHGSCAVVRKSEEFVVLVDAGPNGSILQYLSEEGITKVDAVILSHADADHIGGLSGMLSNGIEIGNVYVNSDAMKTSSLWKELVYQLDEIKMQCHHILAGECIESDDGSIRIEILAPRVRLDRLGPGSSDREGRRITTNSVSVVVRVVAGGSGRVLIPGDVDAVGLQHLFDSEHRVGLSSKVLVAPHHGGRCGGVAETSRAWLSLLSEVDPEVVVVSNGREKVFDNPIPDVLAAVESRAGATELFCTQLSKGCSLSPVLGPRLSTGIYSAGGEMGISCAGSIRIGLGSDSVGIRDRTVFRDFIMSQVASPRCRGVTAP